MEKKITMFISPRINVGEKAAGGTVEFFTGKDTQVRLELWAYADLKPDSQGGGRIANPVPVDSWGINSSPIFFEENDNAYYVVYDAKGSIIRQGYVKPYSWHDGGSAPDPVGPWDEAADGDWFWGYEVVENASELANHDIVGRPLFLATGAIPGDMPVANGGQAGDRSGGLIVWAVASQGAGDNIITFNSSQSGTVWKARERELFYSYLASVITNGQNPFAFLEANYPGQYDINLDILPNINSQPEFSGKVVIDRPISGSLSGIGVIQLSDPSKLDIRVPQAFSVTGGGQGRLYFNVKGGDWNGNYTTYSDGMCALHGKIGSYLVYDPQQAISFRYAEIDYLTNANPAKITFTNSSVSKIAVSNHIPVMAYNLASIPGLKTVVLKNDLNVDLANSDGFDFDVEAISGNLLLTDSEYDGANPCGYYIKPSKSIVFNSNFYASNAGFYSVAQPLIGLTGHTIGSNCSGTFTLSGGLDDLLILDSKNVDVVSAEQNTAIWVKAAGRIMNATVKLDLSAGADAYFDVEGMNRCVVQAGYWTWPTPQIGDGMLRAFLRGCALKECDVQIGAQRLVLLGSKMLRSTVQGMERFAGGNGNSNFFWSSVLEFGCGSEVSGCEFADCVASLYAESGNVLRSIKFNGNKAASQNTFLNLLNQGMSGGAGGQSYTYPMTAEDVEIVGNHADSNNNAFKVLCSAYQSETVPFMKGHIEIDGYYDYLYNGLNPIAGRTFPMEAGANLNTLENLVIKSSDGTAIEQICVSVYGDPLKYGEKDGRFVTAGSYIKNMLTQTPQNRLQYNNITISLFQNVIPANSFTTNPNAVQFTALQSLWSTAGTVAAYNYVLDGVDVTYDGTTGSTADGLWNPAFTAAVASLLGYATPLDLATNWAANGIPKTMFLSSDGFGFIPAYADTGSQFQANNYIGWVFVLPLRFTGYSNSMATLRTKHTYYNSSSQLAVTDRVFWCGGDVMLYRIRE